METTAFHVKIFRVASQTGREVERSLVVSHNKSHRHGGKVVRVNLSVTRASDRVLLCAGASRLRVIVPSKLLGSSSAVLWREDYQLFYCSWILYFSQLVIDKGWPDF